MTIQYVMLVALGFLAASFIVLLLAPAFWSRAVRLTAARLRESMPATETEIRADKDKLRADYAMKIYRLESRVDQAKLGSARQLIELNRRDATISDLEAKLGAASSALEENQNARRVLEQTITERLPRVELHLEEARRLLAARDQDIATLTDTTRRQQDALSEARAILEKQSGEIERLTSALLASEAGSRRTGGREAEYDVQLALRNELEAARSRAREQAAMIDRLQAEISVTRLNTPARVGGSENGEAKPEMEQLVARMLAQTKEVEKLKAELGEAQSALKEARGRQLAVAPAPAPPPELEQELRRLRARAEDQDAEVSRLKAELEALSKAGEEKPSLLKDNRFNLKAKLSGLEAKTEEQNRTIQRLRVELAAANERSARQAAQAREEMKRAGMAPHVLARDNLAAARDRGSMRVAERAAQVLRSARFEDAAKAVDASSPQPHAAEANGIEHALKPINDDVHTMPALTERVAAAGASPAQGEEQEQVVFLPSVEGQEAQKDAGSANGVASPAPRRSRLLDRLATFGKG
jgi:hypothetical protein